MFHNVMNNAQLLLLANKFKHLNKRSFHEEVEDYLLTYPSTEQIDIYLNDINGGLHLKSIPVEALWDLEHGCYFPLSIYARESVVSVTQNSGPAKDDDELNRLCMPVSGTLKPRADNPQRYAQVMMTMKNTDGSPCGIEPRVILQRALAALNARGICPAAEAELEFRLDGMTAPAARPCAPSPQFPHSDAAAPVRLLAAIETQAKRQGLPLRGVTYRDGAGKFTLALYQDGDIVTVCDNLQAMKRLIGHIAGQYGRSAHFKTGLYPREGGCGLRFRVGLSNVAGENLLAAPGGGPNDAMHRALAGLLALTPASLALLAPDVGVLRRLRGGGERPFSSRREYRWRDGAWRLLCADGASRRINYALAGAGANPYLALSAILAGIAYGFDPTQQPAALEKDNAPLPLSRREALDVFHANEPLRYTLGAEFCRLWYVCKMAELKTARAA
ncbi:glutamine synthetase [Martelella alba]|uniref:Glutamine synthetase n=1 Tax=Martelella alba TaxID=2590451 RepID=A0ABY2SPB2_9HYPH|nr:glutamine synthetase [Martelella alba]TKI07849.1 glutamine synthetase [Martelella alba]